jgi:hypothetical protein
MTSAAWVDNPQLPSLRGCVITRVKDPMKSGRLNFHRGLEPVK